MSKTIADYTAANSIDASNDYLLLEPSGNTVYKKINRNVLLGLSSTPLGLTDSQSPTNKVFDNTNSLTVKDGSLTIQNSSSTTKQAVFSAASITAGQTRTFTLPDASGTLVTTGGTQTLTAKTLTSPTITGGTLDNTTVTVDSISGHTVATTVTVANLQIANGVLNTANAVTSTSIAVGAIQPQALVSGTGSGWAWSNWTPSYANLTIGNGAVTAKYIQTGKTISFIWRLILGTTSVIGSSPTISFPVTAHASYTTNDQVAFGFANANTANGFIVCSWISSTTFGPNVYTASGTYVSGITPITATIPGTWAAASSLTLQGFYEAA